MKRYHRPAAIVGTGILLVSLTGCFGNPLDKLMEGAGQGAIQDIIKDQTGVDVNIGGGSASVPDAWPNLPLPDGEVISSVTVEETMSVFIQVPNEAGVLSVIDQLKAQGYESTGSADYGEMKTEMLKGPEWTAILGWFSDDEDGWTLTYSVSPTTD